MALTVKQELFADFLAFGLNQTESYRRAYNVTRMSAASIKVEASRLSRHPKVAARVELLRKQHPRVKRAVPSLSNEWLVMELQDLASSPYTTSTTKANVLTLLSKVTKKP